jgi:prophage maintenance system killer protein
MSVAKQVKDEFKNSQIEIYQDDNGNIQLDVRFDGDTAWLTQKMIANLFSCSVENIILHLKNIYQDAELDESATTKDFLVVQKEGNRSVKRQLLFYNLDVIIAVGYRVNSKQATQFRIWATKRLKDYLIQGYAINHNIIDTTHQEYQNIIDLLGRTLINNRLEYDQQTNIINLISQYAKTWTTLLQYDEDSLLLPSHKDEQSIPLEYNTAQQAISSIKQQLMNIGEATALFGNERNDQLQSILANLEQTMFGEELYKSIAEKSANLLYMVIKDHPFSDGNKRIGSFLFLLYVQINKLPVKLDSIALTSLALLVAESQPSQKDLLIRLIVNLLVYN